MTWIALEHHPNDSRLKISGEICQTLNRRMGTGGGNVPLLMRTYDARGNGDGKTVCTITGKHQSFISDYTAILVGKEKEEMDVVRRLTPLECERLQGFPDGWTDIGEWVDRKGKKRESKDAGRYMALGNSIGLPSWYWLVNRMKPFLRDGATMGSLFDGIGGFPLVWEETYGKGNARWASEIEEFPIAVTKKHFPEEE